MLAGLLATLVLVVPPVGAANSVSATAPVCVRITGGIFDAPGDDTTMPGLNGEYVILKNGCSSTSPMGGWILTDANGNRYGFASSFALGPGGYVRLRSGTGINGVHDIYWGRLAGEVWNNAPPERAYLRDPSGRLQFSWSPYTDRILIGAGDIASCSGIGDERTAALLVGVDGTVLTLGDNVYENGTAAEFSNCYAPSWGRELERTRPATGNHDYNTSGASPYFAYFGTRAGAAGKGYYSYDRGAWHVVVLNSNCGYVGGCDRGSPQEQWLRSDLAAHPSDCTLAYWHHPLFSSGLHGNNTSTSALWQALYDYHGDVVLSGHDHDYERFAPQTATGTRDSARGLREFVVGTGGRSLYGWGTLRGNSEVRNNSTAGVLQLTLYSHSYSWSFTPVAGATFRDSGSTYCH